MLLLSETTEFIIQCFYKVYNTLGYGFLEKVYENAMIIELRKNKLSCQQQKRVHVLYEGIEVGIYFADILVDDKVIVEIKAGKGTILPQHEYQLMNYLKATQYEVGLLFHFGEKPAFKRKILTINHK
jgi:GxxExxY protein